MRPGPATPAASFVDLSSCLPAARSNETTVPVRQRSPGVPLLPVRAQTRDSENHFSATSAVVASGPTRSGSGKWRRPQCPGNRHALARVSEFPLAIHPRELPAATSVTAIIIWQALRFATFPLIPLWARMLRPATEKPFPLVQKLWTGRLPCGSLRKSAQEPRPDKCWSATFQ